jgi:ecdysteroid 22-hydroxylase
VSFDDLELEFLITRSLDRNGEQWWKLRSEMQKGLSSPKNVRDFLPKADESVKDFMRYLPKAFDENNEIDEFLEDLNRIYIELTCLIAFDERLNSFSDEERKEGSRSSRLIKASEDTNHSILPTDQSFQMYRFYETVDYKRLKESQQFMEQIAVELVKKRIKNPHDGNSLLDQYLLNPNVDVKDIHGMAADLLLAGVHTSAFTSGFALQYIAKDKRVQELLYAEALRVLPNVDDAVTPAVMNSEIPYARAVLKETFRLNPISIGIGRVANKNMVLGGYEIPKNVRRRLKQSISILESLSTPRRFSSLKTGLLVAWKNTSQTP